MSNYIRHPRTPSHWLCADGSTITEPRVEKTPAGRRVRIHGDDESHSQHELNNILYRWVYQQARRKGTAPVLNLQCDPNDENAREELIGLQAVGSINSYFDRLRQVDSFTPFTSNDTGSTAAWVFRHASLPLFAAVAMRVDLSGSHSPPSVTYKVGFPNLTQGSAERHSNSPSYHSRHRPNNVLHGSEDRTQALARQLLVQEEFVERVVEILDSNGVAWGKHTYPNNEAVMADAIRGYRHIDSLSTLSLPDYRKVKPEVDDSSLGSFTFRFEEAAQPESYLAEMQEYAEMLAPANAIVDAWTTIRNELARRGISVNGKKERDVLELLTGTSDELAVELAPINRLAGKFAHDSKHRVTLNLIKGVVHVGCDHQHDQNADVLAFELAKERAAITGETDLLEAFMASVGKVRQDHETNRIVTAAHDTHRHTHEVASTRTKDAS